MKVNFTIGIPAWLDRICAWPVLLYRKHKYGDAFRRINLGEGRFTILNPQDFYRLNNLQWFAEGKGDLLYAMRNVISPNQCSRRMRMHREIMNAPDGLLVDHRNGNGLDNRRDNLRLATHAQNRRNRRKTKSKTSSRFIGVYYEKRTGLWGARLRCNGNYEWLGRFKTEIEAAKAYDAKAKDVFGEFAALNSPESQTGRSDEWSFRICYGGQAGE